MTAIEGGYRDRLIILSTKETVRQGLEDIGWFDDPPGTPWDQRTRAHEPFNWRDNPVAHDEEIPYNTVVVTFDDADTTEAELGSSATTITHVGYVDFYAEPPPPDGQGGEALGKHVIGDILAILVGQMPSIDRDRPIIEVLDYGLATPSYVFSVYVDNNRTTTSRVHRQAHQPWERWWYTCYFELTEERFGDDGDEAHGYAGGYGGGY